METSGRPGLMLPAVGSLSGPAEQSVLQLLPADTSPKGTLLFLDPIVKDQARMGSSNMPGGSTPVSSASMMSGQFCC